MIDRVAYIMKQFDGKTVYITGGSSGIGRETVKLFAEKIVDRYKLVPSMI